MSLPNAPSIPLSESHPAYPALILAGFRYCLGRMTHVSSSCASILIETWDKLPADIQATIASEISLALAGNGAGMSSDVEGWAAVLSRSAGTEPSIVRKYSGHIGVPCGNWQTEVLVWAARRGITADEDEALDVAANLKSVLLDAPEKIRLDLSREIVRDLRMVRGAGAGAAWHDLLGTTR